MAHPGFPIRLDPSWTWYLNVVAAYVVRDDGAGGQEFADIVNDDVLDISGTDFSIVDDPTHGHLLRSTGNGGGVASISSPTDYWSSLDAISVIYWDQKDTFSDSSPYWIRWSGSFGEMPFRIVDFGSGNDGITPGVGTDTTTTTVDNFTISGSSNVAIAIGVTWSSSSGEVQAHSNTNHGSGAALSGNTVRSNANDIEFEDHNHDVYAVIVLDVELTDAQWDTVAGEDPFEAFTQAEYVAGLGQVRVEGFQPTVSTETPALPITVTAGAATTTAVGFAPDLYIPPPDGWSTVTIQYAFDPDEDNVLDAAGGTDNSANLENGVDELRWGDVQGCVNLSVNADGTYTADTPGTFSYEIWDDSASAIIQSGTVQVIEYLETIVGNIHARGPSPLFVPGQEVRVPTGVINFDGQRVTLAVPITVAPKVGIIHFIPNAPQRLVTEVSPPVGVMRAVSVKPLSIVVVKGWIPLNQNSNNWSAIAAVSGVQTEL